MYYKFYNPLNEDAALLLVNACTKSTPSNTNLKNIL